MSKVTVIVPSYNHEKYVEETLESIKKQTFIDYDVIIIDDASKDSTASIIENFITRNSLNWTFIKRERNYGIVPNIMLAIEKSESEYITMVASDDFWDSEKLSEEVHVLESESNVTMVFSDYCTVDSDSKIQKKVLNRKRIKTYSDIALGGDFPPASMMFKKKALKHSMADISELIVEDLFIWLSCLSNKDSYAYIIPKCLVYYRLHSGNTAKKVPLKMLENHYKIVKYFEKPSNENTNKACASWALRNFNYLSRRYKKQSLVYMKRCLVLFYKKNFIIAFAKLILLWF